MLGPALPILTFLALAQARAIVINHCPYSVYVWSVPQVLSSSHTDNVPIKPGGQYQEPWRHGSIVNPGVAIKISTKSNGILKYADEIDFAYAVDGNDDSKIWVDLSSVRGDVFKDNLAFHSCNVQYNSPNVQTHQCTATDDVELVLCDTSPRSTPKKDPTTLEQVKACYDYHHVLPEGHEDSLQVAADDDTDSDSDTDCCESRDVTSIKFAYTMEVTAEFTAPPTSEATAESVLAPSVDNPSALSAKAHSSPTNVQSSTNVTSTTTSTSSVRLFTPPHARETDCPGCEKLLILSPCLARVIYPARRRAPAVPRHTPDAITPRHGANPPLCEIVRRYHPGIEHCDEATLESLARSIYPNTCDPEYATLFMGFPCEEIMEEFRRIYPGIDAPKVSRTTCECEPGCDFCGHFNDSCFCAGATSVAIRDDIQPLPTDLGPGFQKMCLYSVCNPMIHGVSCNQAKELLISVLMWFGERYEDWVDEKVDDDCDEVSVLQDDNGQYGICIADLCDLYPENCDKMQTILTFATKAKFDKDVVYMTSHIDCALWSNYYSGKY
ncbi:uncharacterized protein ALTATR162_LOCUS629 [Alternaria atra]|uniref:Uncharacterized protein n=1 Tax=Alternaria atra TaxID=119953 RepID=A0A8J2N1J9_9PLEO|nr:uncharacterized protein ALTATR162_LOCUS629 [Alternaria atra]CAG5140069.1 unnamed protein product [Alternaria atra]